MHQYSLIFPYKIFPVLLTFFSLSFSYTGQWIWQAQDGPSDTWMCFRKKITIDAKPQKAPVQIAVDSRYWLWVNGTQVIFDGGLKRGPTPSATYADEVDIAPYLTPGSNTIAVLVWYWGTHAEWFREVKTIDTSIHQTPSMEAWSYKTSGKGGLFMDGQIGSTLLATDATWKMKVYTAYSLDTNDWPSQVLPERNTVFDAAKAIPGWFLPSFDDSQWGAPVVKGVPPAAPWGELWKRPIPHWKNSGLVSYVNQASLPSLSSGDTIKCKIPYNAQVTPYMKIDAPRAGMWIRMQTDNFWQKTRARSVRNEYYTVAGVQEYEGPQWTSGEEMRYLMPAGIKILELKYRESGYNTEFAGEFTCNDQMYNKLWGKARRTLYVCIRDIYMDCPDRERSQWWGDAATDIGESNYCLDTNIFALSRKAISNLVRWQTPAGVLYSPVPGNYTNEQPIQMLTSIGWYGFWTYFMYSADTAAMRDAYPYVKKYFTLWQLDNSGLIIHRQGGMDWGDWGTNIDLRLLDNTFFYLALKAAIRMAVLANTPADTVEYHNRMVSIAQNFNRVCWKGSQYASPGYGGSVDDRGNAMAVVAGLADTSYYSAIVTVLQNAKNASPYMEKYVLEALFLMGRQDQAFARMKDRYTPLVNDPYSTLPEFWGGYDANGTRNHAWAGGPLTLMSQYAAGVAPDKPGWDRFHVMPQTGPLSSIDCKVPSRKGLITVAHASSVTQFSTDLTVPAGTEALVGIPKDKGGAFARIDVNKMVVWRKNGQPTGGISGIVFAGEDKRYVKFTAIPGVWHFATALTDSSSPVVVPMHSLKRGAIEILSHKNISVACNAEGPFVIELVSLDGARVARREGSGKIVFHFDKGMLRGGTYLLYVKQGDMAVRERIFIP